MNKIFLSLIALTFFLTPVLVSAQTVSAKTVSIKTNVVEDSFFDLEIKDIVALEGTDLSLFYFAPINIQDSSKISSWKVRFYCEDDMKIRFSDVTKDSCGQAVDMPNTANNTFFMLFENKSGESKNFSIALKAYDQNGKWIHTERQRFGWN